MPFNAAIVGAKTDSIVHAIDARWLMAYAAGIGDLNAAYLDTAAHAVIAHPLFPVCLEWPAILACFDLPGAESITPEERARNVHANHDLQIFRSIEAGDRLETVATVVGLEQIKPGAAQTIRLDTHNSDGELVCRTYQLGIKRGVAMVGEAKRIDAAPTPPAVSNEVANEVEIPIAAQAAHVYTECARIWNPVHTDRAVALAAGLPDIILHGTATMAFAITEIVDRILAGDSRRVKRIGGRFSAMVLMPSTVTLVIHHPRDNVIGYSVLTQDGQAAISGGYLCFE